MALSTYSSVAYPVKLGTCGIVKISLPILTFFNSPVASSLGFASTLFNLTSFETSQVFAGLK